MTNTISTSNPMSTHPMLAVRPRVAEFGVLGAVVSGAAVRPVGTAVGVAINNAAHATAGDPPRGTPR